MKNSITNLAFKVPEYNKAKHGQHIATLEWCFDSPQNMLGYIRVTPSANGYLELANKIAALPLSLDKDSDILFETLQKRAETILHIANRGIEWD